ncbi:uncharacterized protein MYCFIDRAFT_182911 [Pseudocercospora fijiensis CIRAD86]|uniref:Uncharacterized protein n=1 Tax=Pseudocercospora fijiensis (strain CIRAD86) TaxID=383855 RepID=M3AAR9_PSEFD|nr:uncharacterized protein MYCFIDRAFT_182911 [Pseudocercospora fijiensis CIRAD86]EME81671.1 hypothetical protein MYCFIDRAFT_182911 [Pseudocercospora fijiensis CIRAD86]
MNTIRSVGYGWGVLIVAGAGSYYFAKKSINADREERAAHNERLRQSQNRLRAQEAVSRDAALSSASAKSTGGKGESKYDTPSPSREANEDPAPTHHESKYEAKDPFRSRKGDRFS